MFTRPVAVTGLRIRPLGLRLADCKRVKFVKVCLENCLELVSQTNSLD